MTGYEIDSELSKEYNNVKHESFISAPLTDKYDVVIGNPPYIRWKNLEPELRNELVDNSLWNQYFNSLCDYLFIFILKSIEQLNESGELLFICSDYWLNSTHAESLRNYMIQNGFFSDIYQFKEAPLFDNVTASVLLFKYVKNTTKRTQSETAINFYRYIGHGMPSAEALQSRKCFVQSSIPQFQMGKRWILANADLQQQLICFEARCSESTDWFSKRIVRLGEFCDIGNGMVSGLDNAFKLDEDAGLNAHETSCTITVLKARSLDQFTHNEYTKYMFMLNAPKNYTEEEFRNLYPNFYRKLCPFIPALQKRYCYNQDLPYWNFAFPRNQKLFERKEDKIFVPCKERISNKNHFRFCLAPNGVYPLQDVTCIVRKKNCHESLEYLLAYLNSDIVFNWLCTNGIMKGEIVEFSEAPIASIPFRRINWQSNNEIALHNRIGDSVKKYIRTRDKSYKQEFQHVLGELLTNEG